MTVATSRNNDSPSFVQASWPGAIVGERLSYIKYTRVGASGNGKLENADIQIFQVLPQKRWTLSDTAALSFEEAECQLLAHDK